MSRFNNILHSLFAFCIVAVLCGCSSDRISDVEELGLGSFYLRLHLSTNGEGGTRAVEDHPYGGEEGDGTEEVDAAHPHEDDIHDLTIFIYNSTTGVNDVATTPIKASQYIGGLSLTSTTGYYTTDPIEIKNKDYVKAVGDKIIVLANMGDQSGKTNLGEVRDLLVNTAWARNGSSIKDYYYFAMSSTSDGTLDTSTPGTYSDPFVGDAYIERVAARIDFWLIKDLDTDEDYATYNVGTGTDKFRLSHVRIVNGSQMPTYNLKRTASAVNPDVTGITYLGDETAGTAIPHIPTNYVVEPLTNQKHGSAVISNTTLNYWFGASSLKNSTSLDFLNNSESKIASHKLEKFTTPELDHDMDNLDGIDDDKITCYTLGYVMENTMDKTGQIPQFATGLELKGTFVPDPSHVNKLSGGVAEADYSYSPGSDFWYYVKADESEKIIFSNEADATTYEAAHPGTVKKYTNGECYYYVWIRHAMFGSGTGEGTGEFRMEYGIVRNNIYRIGVRKVEFIGTEVPDPGATPLTSTMTVREWRLLKHSEIVL